MYKIFYIFTKKYRRNTENKNPEVLRTKNGSI